MKKLLMRALGAAMLMAIPVGVSAQHSAQTRTDHREDQRRPATTQTPAKKQAAQKKPAQTQKSAAARNSNHTNSPYGRWDQSWGAQPPAPPKHWSKKSDWHRHVRACQQKYRSYNARTDSYRTQSGKTLRCRL